MILLQQNDTTVALFGSGLIGRSILTAMRRIGFAEIGVLPFDWDATADRGRETNDILQRLAGRDVQVIWSAGRAGFAASRSDVDQEKPAFVEALDLCRTLGERCSFHLISSAGGLFEGSLQISRATPPNPQRPYGELKLWQEDALTASGIPSISIYRASTVYGFAPGARAGLVSTLIQNALRNQVSVLFGRPDTLRDYIYVDDIGTYVAGRVGVRQHGVEIIHLASGRATSTYEVTEIVRQTVGRNLYVRYDAKPSNAAPMSFLRSEVPEGLNPVGLEVGIAATEMLVRKAHSNPNPGE